MRIAIFLLALLGYGILGFGHAFANASWDSKKFSGAAMGLLNQNAGKFDCKKECVHSLTNEFSVRLKDGLRVGLLFSSAPKNFDCHACAPQLSIFIFEDTGANWENTSTHFAFTNWGSWGSFSGSQATLKPLSDDRFAIFLEGGYGNQGYFGEFLSVLEISDNAPKEIFSACLAVDNSGAVGDDAANLEKWEADYQVGLSINPAGQAQAIVSLQKRDLNDGSKHYKPAELQFDGDKFIETSTSGEWQSNCF